MRKKGINAGVLTTLGLAPGWRRRARSPSRGARGRRSELKEAVEHHVDEEENELFPQAERLLGADRLREIGRQMEEMKRTQSAAAARGGTP